MYRLTSVLTSFIGPLASYFECNSIAACRIDVLEGKDQRRLLVYDPVNAGLSAIDLYGLMPHAKTARNKRDQDKRDYAEQNFTARRVLQAYHARRASNSRTTSANSFEFVFVPEFASFASESKVTKTGFISSSHLRLSSLC